MRRRMGEGKDPYNRALARHRDRFPIKVTWPDIRLGQDDERDRLVVGDETELLW